MSRKYFNSHSNSGGGNDDCQCAFHCPDESPDQCECLFHLSDDCPCEFHRPVDEDTECCCPYHSTTQHQQEYAAHEPPYLTAVTDASGRQELDSTSPPCSIYSPGASSIMTVEIDSVLEDVELVEYGSSSHNEHFIQHQESSISKHHPVKQGLPASNGAYQGGEGSHSQVRPGDSPAPHQFDDQLFDLPDSEVVHWLNDSSSLSEEWPRNALQLTTSSLSCCASDVAVVGLEHLPIVGDDMASEESSHYSGNDLDGSSSDGDDDLAEAGGGQPLGGDRHPPIIGSSDDSDNPDDVGEGGHLSGSDFDGSDGSEPPDPSDSEASDIYDDSDDSHNSSQNITLGNEDLNRSVQLFEGCTVRETVAMVTALSVRKHQDYQTIMEHFSILNMVTGCAQFPTDKRKLWRLMGLHVSGARKHAYCWTCQRSLGRVRHLLPGTRCCGVDISPKNVKYFITLPLKKQLQQILDTPGAADRLSYRERRVKRDEDAVEDIFDGAAYKRLMDQPNGLRPPYDFSYVANFDGFSVSKSSNNEGCGLMLRLNELKPNLRQKNVILCAFWCDTKQPRYNLFLRKFVREANTLSGEGILWKPDGVNQVTSRIFPTVFPLDCIARCGGLCMTQFNGLYGCSFCEHPGVSVDRVWKYPVPGTVVIQQRRGGGERHVVIPAEIPLRTHESMMDIMARVRQHRIMGIKQASELADLNFFDLAQGFSTDDLHPIYLGAAKHHTELLMGLCRNKAETERVINQRLKAMQMPSVVSRKPRPFSQRGKWNGTEWRNWLLYQGVPCFQGLVPDNRITHFGMLSKGAFIASRDVITQAQLQMGDHTMRVYQELMQQYYGPACMWFVVHEVGHVFECIRNWGNMWCHSTFPFESKNHWLGLCVTSPRALVDQVVDRYLLLTLVENCQYRADISEEVRDKIFTLLSPWAPKIKKKCGDVWVFGDGERRQLTLQETALMEEEHVVGYLEGDFHKRIKANACVCRPHAHSIGIKSNDSLIYTTDDMFCEIQSIVVLGNEPHQSVGLFCKVCNVGNPLCGVPHILEVENMEDNVFVKAEDVRNSAMMITVQGRTFVMPMPHQNDID